MQYVQKPTHSEMRKKLSVFPPLEQTDVKNDVFDVAPHDIFLRGKKNFLLSKPGSRERKEHNRLSNESCIFFVWMNRGFIGGVWGRVPLLVIDRVIRGVPDALLASHRIQGKIKQQVFFISFHFLFRLCRGYVLWKYNFTRSMTSVTVALWTVLNAVIQYHLLSLTVGAEKPIK